MVSLCGCSNGGNGGDASTDGSGEAAPTTCAGDNDCPGAGSFCYFVIDGGCSISGVSGVCLFYTQPQTCTPNVSCGCDGTTISICAPSGYVNRQSNYAGPCPADAGTDAGTDAATDGATDGSTDALPE